MPDAHGNFRGMSVPADAWERIFGKPRTLPPTCNAGMIEAGNAYRRPPEANRDNRPADK